MIPDWVEPVKGCIKKYWEEVATYVKNNDDKRASKAIFEIIEVLKNSESEIADNRECKENGREILTNIISVHIRLGLLNFYFMELEGTPKEECRDTCIKNGTKELEKVIREAENIINARFPSEEQTKAKTH